MPTVKLTARSVAAIRPGAGRADHWDPTLRGFGLRVMPTGAKSWTVLYRIPTQRWARRHTIGTYPALSLAKARKLAKLALAEAGTGQDPAGEKREQRETTRQTVRALFEAYERHVAVRRKAGQFSSWPDVKRSLERDVLPDWGTRPVTEIRRADVIDLVTRKALSGPIAANRLQAHVSMLFKHGVESDWLQVSPTAGLRKPAKEHRKAAVVTPDDLRKLWAVLEAGTPVELARGKGARPMPPDTGQTLRDLFKVLALCGQRLGETSRMKWAHVDLDGKVWIIPASETKNRRAHGVPLSKPVAEILKRRQGAAKSGASFVFPSGTARDSSVLLWSKRAAAAFSRMSGVSFTAHALRRTLATQLGELGTPRDTIDAILNHTAQGVIGHYDFSTRQRQARAALDRWAQRLAQIVTGKRASVTPIRARA